MPGRVDTIKSWCFITVFIVSCGCLSLVSFNIHNCSFEVDNIVIFQMKTQIWERFGNLSKVTPSKKEQNQVYQTCWPCPKWIPHPHHQRKAREVQQIWPVIRVFCSLWQRTHFAAHCTTAPRKMTVTPAFGNTIIIFLLFLKIFLFI